MNVKELKKILENLPDDLEIFTASDDEGNSFRKVPNGWCSVEKMFDGYAIAKEDYDHYGDDLIEVVIIG